MNIEEIEKRRRQLLGEALSITAKVTLEALHRWAEAPDKVFYLDGWHRHLFTCEVRLLVSGGNRAVEFHTFQQEVLEPAFKRCFILRSGGALAGAVVKWSTEKSCEAMAQEVAHRLIEAGYTPASVDVSEDGQNSGIWKGVWACC